MTAFTPSNNVPLAAQLRRTGSILSTASTTSGVCVALFDSGVVNEVHLIGWEIGGVAASVPGAIWLRILTGKGASHHDLMIVRRLPKELKSGRDPRFANIRGPLAGIEPAGLMWSVVTESPSEAHGHLDGLNGIDIRLDPFKERWETHIGRVVTPRVETDSSTSMTPAWLVSDIRILASKHFWGDALCNGGLYFFVARPDVFQINRIAILVSTD